MAKSYVRWTISSPNAVILALPTNEGRFVPNRVARIVGLLRVLRQNQDRDGRQLSRPTCSVSRSVSTTQKKHRSSKWKWVQSQSWKFSLNANLCNSNRRRFVISSLLYSWSTRKIDFKQFATLALMHNGDEFVLRVLKKKQGNAKGYRPTSCGATTTSWRRRHTRHVTIVLKYKIN